MNSSSSGLQAGEIVSPALTSPKEPEGNAFRLSAELAVEEMVSAEGIEPSTY
jgi:hypothetical protein